MRILTGMRATGRGYIVVDAGTGERLDAAPTPLARRGQAVVALNDLVRLHGRGYRRLAIHYVRLSPGQEYDRATYRP